LMSMFSQGVDFFRSCFPEERRACHKRPSSPAKTPMRPSPIFLSILELKSGQEKARCRLWRSIGSASTARTGRTSQMIRFKFFQERFAGFLAEIGNEHGPAHQIPYWKN